MGQSTDGQICFGIGPFEEGTEFAIETWWQKVNGYVNPNFNPFTDSGNYKPGVEKADPRIDVWFAHEREWNKANPVPVELVNCCSGDYPMYIIAVPRTCKSASRGSPESFDPGDLKVTAEERRALVAFCEEHEIEAEDDELPEPKWWLSSYWG